jgi:hypothetical protein
MNIDIDKSTIAFIFIFVIVIVLILRFIIIPYMRQCSNASRVVITDGFSFKAGGRFDEVYISFPFVNVEFGKTDICIKGSGAILNLSYDNIISVTENNELISPKPCGVEVKHNDSRLPAKIVIWTPYYKQIIDYIQKLIVTMEAEINVKKAE